MWDFVEVSRVPEQMGIREKSCGQNVLLFRIGSRRDIACGRADEGGTVVSRVYALLLQLLFFPCSSGFFFLVRCVCVVVAAQCQVEQTPGGNPISEAMMRWIHSSSPPSTRLTSSDSGLYCARRSSRSQKIRSDDVCDRNEFSGFSDDSQMMMETMILRWRC